MCHYVCREGTSSSYIWKLIGIQIIIIDTNKRANACNAHSIRLHIPIMDSNTLLCWMQRISFTIS